MNHFRAHCGKLLCKNMLCVPTHTLAPCHHPTSVYPQMTALSVGYIQTYRDSVDSVGESVDMSIKVRGLLGF